MKRKNKLYNKNKNTREIKMDATIEKEEDPFIQGTQNIENAKNAEKTYCIYFLDKTYLFIIYIIGQTVKIIQISLSLYGIYLIWILLHYFASHLYIKFCVPVSFMGLIISPFLTTTPHCQCLRWIVYNGGNIINHMWVIIGSWLSTFFVIKTS